LHGEDWVTGNVGKGVAVIVVITLGVKSLSAEISWGRILLVGGGIALIFGAVAIINLMLEYKSILEVPFCDQEDNIEEFDRRLFNGMR
jgi:TrbC/VIRB2 pilin